MPYFGSKDRTVFSPQNDKLLPLYNVLKKYHPTVGGSNLYEDLVETYEYLDFVFKEEKVDECTTAK